MRVLTHGIVEQLNELEYCRTRLRACLISLMQRLLVLQCREEALRHRIVMTVGNAAHAAAYTMIRQDRLILTAGVVRTSVRMMQ